MKRTFIFVATLVFASTIPAFAQTTNEDTLLQRLATAQGGGKAQVFVGKLPTDLPKIPLPDGSIIGSVHRRTDLRNGTVADSYDLFYDATPQTMSAYQATLTGADGRLDRRREQEVSYRRRALILASTARRTRRSY
jgi:hypothetical protein